MRKALWFRLLGCLLTLWLALPTPDLAAQQAPAARRQQRLKPRQRPRATRPVPPAARPALTRKGEPRKLSPDQLWDAVPDSTHPSRGPFRLLVYAGLGSSVYSSAIRTPGTLTDERESRLGLPVSLRVMWQTDHRLRLGLETGFVNLYSYGGTVANQSAQVRVSAVPILVVFSMSVVKRFALYAGTGPYLINSELRYEGVTKGSTLSLGWMAAGTYTQPLTKNLGLATELKWYDATQTNDACLIAQATLIWRAFTW